MSYGIASALARAKAVAGDRYMLGQGTCTVQQALEVGVLEARQIHQIPVLFEVLPSRGELEIVRVIDAPEATHIGYRGRR